MSYIRVSLYIFLTFNCFKAFNQTIVYAFPGQGADERLFDSLYLPKGYVFKFVNYGTPDRKQNLASFSKTLSAQIDTTKTFVLLGTSLGGMICSEMATFLNPQKTIIISSARHRGDLPFRYGVQKYVPIHYIIPGFVIKSFAQLLQPLVEPDSKTFPTLFENMLSEKPTTYMKRSVKLILNWNRVQNNEKIFRIHGDNDKTIPLKNEASVSKIISKGSHMITLTRGKEVSAAISEILTHTQ